MKKHLILGLISSLTLFFASCSGDENSSSSSSGNVLKKMKFVGENWNADYENHEINFEYENGKLVSYTDGAGLIVNFTYTNDLISHIDKYERFNQESELYLQADFFYDSSGRLLKFEVNHPDFGTNIDTRAEFTYVDNQHANFQYTSTSGQSSHGTITFDDNNVTKLVKNDFNQFGYLYDVEMTMNYDTTKYIFSEVVGFNNLKLYNAFYVDNFYNIERIGIYPGAKNNLTSVSTISYNNGNSSFEGTLLSLIYQYNSNGFPQEVSRNGSNSQKMLFYY